MLSDMCYFGSSMQTIFTRRIKSILITYEVSGICSSPLLAHLSVDDTALNTQLGYNWIPRPQGREVSSLAEQSRWRREELN
jgi:hypothetical protein